MADQPADPLRAPVAELRFRESRAPLVPRGPLAWVALAVRAGRVLAFTVFLLLAALVVYVRDVRASAEQRSVALGRELAQFADVLSGAHRVAINGETIYVAEALSDQGVTTILDRFQKYCDARNGDVPQDFAREAPDKAKELRQALGDDWLDHWGVIREEQGTEGSVMCIAQHEGGGVAGMVAKIRTFMDTWDLHAIGDFRFVYARRVDASHTQVLTSLTDGPFHLQSVLGRGQQEPAGADPPGAPRPPESRRLLSSRVDDAPYGLQVFTTPMAVSEVLAFYERELPARGWSRLVANREMGAQAWQRHGVTMVIGAGRAEKDDESKVTFTEGRTVPASAVDGE